MMINYFSLSTTEILIPFHTRIMRFLYYLYVVYDSKSDLRVFSENSPTRFSNSYKQKNRVPHPCQLGNYVRAHPNTELHPRQLGREVEVRDV